MRILLRSAALAALFLTPATAMAFVWPFARPAIPEYDARMLATDYGVTSITDIDGTIDGDWKVEGFDPYGNEVELVIDGTTGEVERAEMESD